MAKYTVTLAAGELWENGVTKFVQCPSNGEGIDGIIVKNSAGSVLGTFSLVDSNGAATSGIPNMWASGYYIQVRFDTVNSKAQLLNGAISQAVLDKINAITPAQIGAAASSDLAKYLPRDGSAAMTGALKIAKTDNGRTQINKNHSATADYGTDVADYGASGKFAKLSIKAELNNITFTNNTGAVTEILHTGNKPTGSYTGNGSAESRTIETGGIGNAILIYSGTGIAIVTKNGAVVFYSSSASFLAVTSAKFSDGVLTLATTNSVLNGSQTYNYQVL